MRNALVVLSVFAGSVCFAQTNVVQGYSNRPPSSAPITPCDCTSYPFKPNPPCFGSCVGKLASIANPNLSTVKGLDPGVSVSIRVLAANPKKDAIDFSGMQGKPDLERAADKLLRSTDLRFQPSRQDFQLQR